jgi:hypothetical protein
MPALKWTPPKTTHGIDRRRVAMPRRRRRLIRRRVQTALGYADNGNDVAGSNPVTPTMPV